MPHAELVDGQIYVQTQWNEAELVKQVPGITWDGDARAWHIPVNWTACIQLRGIFGERLTVGRTLAEWSQHEFESRVRPSLHLRDLIEHHELTDARTNPKLFPFQRVGVEWLTTSGHALLADEMGGGKTIQALTVIEELSKLGEQALPALVVCPNSVKFNWAREAGIWAPSANPYVIDGSAKAKRDTIARAAKDDRALVVVNIEAIRSFSRLAGFGSQALRRCTTCGGKDPKLKSTACEAHPKELNGIPWRTIVMDEAHRIKDPNAKQTRAAWFLGRQPTVTRRIALTGTPIANHPADLWSLMHFVDHVEYPMKSKFVNRYCLMDFGTYGGMEVLGLHPNTQTEFYKFFDPRFRRMPKSLVLSQLPPKVPVTRLVEMSPKQRKAYKDIEQEMTTFLPDGSLMVAADNLEMRLRMLQFSNAMMEAVPGGGWQMCDPSPKIDELMLVLEEMGEKPVAVAAYHRQLIDLAAARLDKAKISYGLFTGKQKAFERELALRDFQAGKLRVLLFTMAAGGTGTTMTAADTLVRLQRSDSMIDNMQTEDRVHRIGSEKHNSVLIIDVVTSGTLEEGQIETLLTKRRRLEEIVRDIEKLKAAGLDVSQLQLLHDEILNSDLAGAKTGIGAVED